MLKVIVFDSGYGGEFFADRLEEAVPTLEIVRVIDWRNAEKFLTNPHEARKLARASLRPYIGKVDLIIFANHLLTITSLKYFRRKYKNQQFVGMHLKHPDTFKRRDTLVLTTRAVTRTVNYYNFLIRLKRRVKTVTLDAWPGKIDDGELSGTEIRETLLLIAKRNKMRPEEMILACAQFNEIKPELLKVFGPGLRIYDSFDDTLRQVCRALRIRGGTGRKEKRRA